MGIDPIWLGVLIALNLQTSFLTPPFGFALFYLGGVAKDLRTIDIYKGIIPFVIIQLFAVAIVMMFPTIATWLPKALF
jgi:TRAP-type mannitol/chloroaromatic compound transport system permease large subunit